MEVRMEEIRMNSLKGKSVIVSLVCLFTVFFLSACTVNSPSDVFNNAASFLDQKADAYRAACDTLREQLDVPSKAVFPTYDSSFVEKRASDREGYDTMYRIKAYVDAENVFGAMPRSDWSATVYSDESREKFYVVIDQFGGISTGSYDTESDNSDDTGSSYDSDSTSSFGSYSTNNNSNYSSSYDDYYDEDEDDYYDDEDEDDYYDYEDEEDYYDYEDEYEDDYDYEDSTSGYVLPQSDSKKLKKSDLYGLSKEELRIARNEIYARHGRRFQDEELQEYFDEQDWYDGYIEPEDFVDSQMLSKLERRNAKFILKFE